MIHSYGFLEEGMVTARDIFVDLSIPDDDPLKGAKWAVSSCAPGVRIMVSGDKIHWESEFIWIICLNEEDGLLFRIAQTVEGDQELQVTWKGQSLSDTSQLRGLLKTDPLWDLYHLRAIAYIQERIEKQQRFMSKSQESLLPKSNEAHPDIREGPRVMALGLRELEAKLLLQACEYFEAEVNSPSFHK